MFNARVSDFEKSIISHRTDSYPFPVPKQAALFEGLAWKVCKEKFQGYLCPLLMKPFKNVSLMTKAYWTFQDFLFTVLIPCVSGIRCSNTSQKQCNALGVIQLILVMDFRIKL